MSSPPALCEWKGTDGAPTGAAFGFAQIGAEFEGSFSVSWLLGPFLLPVPACSVVSLNQSSLLLGAEFPTALCRDSHEFLHVMGSLLYGACMY